MPFSFASVNRVNQSNLLGRNVDKAGLFVLRFYGPVKSNGVMFVCVEVLRPSQPSGVMSSAVSLPNNTFTRQA